MVRPPYVLQIKLKPAEKAAVKVAASRSLLPLSTWARQILLRKAGLSKERSAREVWRRRNAPAKASLSVAGDPSPRVQSARRKRGAR